LNEDRRFSVMSVFPLGQFPRGGPKNHHHRPVLCARAKNTSRIS
jgi:hypothetical protein